MSPRIVLAPDKFKGSLTAAEAAAAMLDGCRAALPECIITVVPVSDGGEGMLDVAAARNAEIRATQVTGPLRKSATARYAVLGDEVFLETAEACGLAQVPNPDPCTALDATSYGVGELLLAVLDAGYRRIHVGLGGSACTDGGAGMAQALGVRLLDADGTELPLGGAALARLTRIDTSGLDPRLSECTVTVAHDVDNPLVGADGAAPVFGPQKGADADAVASLVRGLERYAGHLEQASPGVTSRAGAGAAGGIGAGAFAFLSAAGVSGAQFLLEVTGARNAIDGAALVLVGEGRLDSQTLRGKAPSAVARLARELGVPCLAIAGLVDTDQAALEESGIQAAYSLTESAGSSEVAHAQASRVLREVTESAVRQWSETS
ncbi:glycerate kinase [Hoyosella subflava]|uniref:Glycerate kinase n=1 Tax=Hoyosella subflava (strain DSM 45089 / JCM 17490 / NBRC 109087 / DQS3-9A1) TaxID=443218 RepID=F6EG85_HOYSD|nr:glycerate kinase [Hoyosella subflava]AEF39810.1 Glycerate kinase [Hoyosella subflava DQS3-9A1]